MNTTWNRRLGSLSNHFDAQVRVALFVTLVSLAGCQGRSESVPGTGASAARAAEAAPRVTEVAETPEVSRERTPAAAELEAAELEAATIHVHPGESIQPALDAAADDPEKWRVVVHSGTYRPTNPGKALIWLNAKHDGITLEAQGDVRLTAANTEIAQRSQPSFPAVVNHVVYFGDGISRRTILRGFRITGANNFVTQSLGPEIQPDMEVPRLAKTLFFYTDGGGIKIFGRSYPTIENNEIYDNYSSPCGAGISIEHRGYMDQAVLIRNCIFLRNKSPLTGAAIDLLDHEHGSSAVIENCLFVQNQSSGDRDALSRRLGTWKPREGHGALTVFPKSRAVVKNCTFVQNRNGVDDNSEASRYESCIFWHNDYEGGWGSAPRYEIDVMHGDGITNCYFGGHVDTAVQARIDLSSNVLDAPDPRFDDQYVPRNPLYAEAGYRPSAATSGSDTAATSGSDTADETATESSSGDGENAARRMESRLRQQGLVIDALARDYNWRFTYRLAGSESSGQPVSARRNLYVPTNVPVRVNLESGDLLYTIYLPQLSVRETAIPGLPQHMEFMVDEAGTSRLVGDQFCGYSHPNLIGHLIAQQPADFCRWYWAQVPVR